MNREELNDDALRFSLISPPMNAAVDRLIFGDQESELPMKITVYTVE